MKCYRDYREYIHIEKHNSGKLILEARNLSEKNIVYLLSAFIESVSEKKDIPPDVLLNLIRRNLNKKEADENEEASE